jgi:hypothetical protein
MVPTSGVNTAIPARQHIMPDGRKTHSYGMAVRKAIDRS